MILFLHSTSRVWNWRGNRRRQRTVSGFKLKYSEQDIRLLAAMDERHDTPCGPAVKKLCEQACEVFGQTYTHGLPRSPCPWRIAKYRLNTDT